MDEREPTVWELLRDVQEKHQEILRRMDTVVTQEQLAAYRELNDLKLSNMEAAHTETKNRLNRLTQGAWTAVVAPVIVGVVLYFLLGGKP